MLKSALALTAALAIGAAACGSNETTVPSGSTTSTGGGAGGNSTSAQGGAGGSAQGGSGGQGGLGGQGGTPQACLEMVETAQAYLDGLDANQLDQGTATFGDAEHTQFEFLPPLSAPRDGVSMKDLSETQRGLLAAFLQKAMSQAGYLKLEAIRALESVLAMQESGVPATDNRDPDNYFVQFYGTPSIDSDDPWGFRFEGHHLSVQAGVIDCSVYSATPAFWGASPQVDPLQAEIDAAAQLVASFNGAQQTQAQGGISGAAINDAKDGPLTSLVPEGLRAGDMEPAQVALLRQLIGAYLGNLNAVIAADRLAALEAAGFDDITFRFNNGDFRVMGPTFIIELIYAGATHIHSVWRDYDGDYGADLIAQHLADFHPASR